MDRLGGFGGGSGLLPEVVSVVVVLPPRRVTGALLEEVLPGLVAGWANSSEEGRRCRESRDVLREVEELRQERGGGGTSYTPSSSPPSEVWLR